MKFTKFLQFFTVLIFVLSIQYEFNDYINVNIQFSTLKKKNYASLRRNSKLKIIPKSELIKRNGFFVKVNQHMNQDEKFKIILQFIQKILNNNQYLNTLLNDLNRKEYSEYVPIFKQQFIEQWEIFERISGYSQQNTYLKSTDENLVKFIESHIKEWSIRLKQLKLIDQTSSE